MPLQFITLTGADDKTHGREIRGLSRHCGVPPFFVEVGILLSKTRQGTPRYPTLAKAYDLVRAAFMAGLRSSFHLCGEWARMMAAGNPPEELTDLLSEADRIQVNGRFDADVVARLLQIEGKPWEFILQSRDPERFPEFIDKRLSWLYDVSGGRGKVPPEWPSLPSEGHVGYAGGLSSDNLQSVLSSIGGPSTIPFWVDMETSLRNEDDVFDIDRCRAVSRIAFSSLQGEMGGGSSMVTSPV